MKKTEFKKLNFPTHKYLHMAMKFYHAASVLYKIEKETASHPLYFLYCHSLELNMKGYLRESGISSVVLKNKGHNLNLLYSDCITNGLTVPGRERDADVKLVDNLNRYYQEKHFEYMELGGMLLPKMCSVAEFADALLKACNQIAPKSEDSES